MPASGRVITSLGAGPQQGLLRLAARSIVPYARRHGYELDLRTELVDGTRPAPWSKVRILQELVERYELVVWLDADLQIVDRRDDIADELEDGRFLYLVEHHTRGWRMPNTGVMMLRGGAESAAFLDAMWRLERYVNHRWWENAAVCELLGYELDPPRRGRPTEILAGTKFISPRWNSIVDAPARHARIRHFPGYSLRTRTVLMLASLAEAHSRAALQAVTG